jgi:hypothetical protein
VIPDEWTCPDGYYTDSFCDCGCGVSEERPTEEELNWEREMMNNPFRKMSKKRNPTKNNQASSSGLSFLKTRYNR